MSKIGKHVDAAIGAKIKAARSKLGWSLRKLAEESGKQQSELSEYERGIRGMRVSSLWVLARALGRPIAWFFKEVKNGRKRK